MRTENIEKTLNPVLIEYDRKELAIRAVADSAEVIWNACNMGMLGPIFPKTNISHEEIDQVRRGVLPIAYNGVRIEDTGHYRGGRDAYNSITQKTYPTLADMMELVRAGVLEHESFSGSSDLSRWKVRKDIAKDLHTAIQTDYQNSFGG